MGQLKIDGTGHGKPVMPFGSDGTDWYAFLIDALGHLQVDVVSAALGSGGATEATLLLIKGYVDALETLLAGGLPAALDSGALKTKEQSPLTGFATAVNQAIIAGYIDALETLLAGGLPAALDSGALKTKEQSPLTGFATSANQTTMITALQLIDDLRAALGSVATDKILVASKSGDKIFGFESILEEALSNTNLAAGQNYLSGTAVPAGKIWRITTACVRYTGTVPTDISITVAGLATNLILIHQFAPVSTQFYIWHGEAYLQVNDYIQAIVNGATLSDGLYLRYAGVQMNAP